MVWELDESHVSISKASMTPECVYDQSVEAVAVLPTLSAQSTLPTEYPLTALLAVSAAQ